MGSRLVCCFLFPHQLVCIFCSAGLSWCRSDWHKPYVTMLTNMRRLDTVFDPPPLACNQRLRRDFTEDFCSALEAELVVHCSSGCNWFLQAFKFHQWDSGVTQPSWILGAQRSQLEQQALEIVRSGPLKGGEWQTIGVFENMLHKHLKPMVSCWLFVFSILKPSETNGFSWFRCWTD